MPGFFAYVAADTMMTISPIFHGKPRQPVAKFSFDISQLDWRSRWLQPLRARVEAVTSSLPLGAFRRKRLDARLEGGPERATSAPFSSTYSAAAGCTPVAILLGEHRDALAVTVCFSRCVCKYRKNNRDPHACSPCSSKLQELTHSPARNPFRKINNYQIQRTALAELFRHPSGPATFDVHAGLGCLEDPGVAFNDAPAPPWLICKNGIVSAPPGPTLEPDPVPSSRY